MITHTPANIPIFQTEDYSKFTFIVGNRPLNKAKIQRIIKEIEGGNNMLPYFPIQVKIDLQNNIMPIIDGQHRFTISTMILQPVYYIIVTQQKSLRDIATINSNTEKWTQENFINCYIAGGSAHYTTLKQFIADYGINVGTSIQLLTRGNIRTGGNDVLTDFQEGKLIVEKLDEAVIFAEKAKKFSKFSQWNTRNFLYALQKIEQAGKVSIDEIAEKFSKNSELLINQSNYKNYITNIELIVNKGKHERIYLV